MPSSRLVTATPADVSQIADLLCAMQSELEELVTDRDVSCRAITASFGEGVTWFLFKDDSGNIFGTCHVQAVHNYWRAGKRFYLGGFYIAPTHRGSGHFKDLYLQLKDWATAHGGVQLYAHIHEDNAKSIQTFQSVGMEGIEYRLFVDNWEGQID